MLKKKDLLLRCMQLEENLNSALWDAKMLHGEVNSLKQTLSELQRETRETVNRLSAELQAVQKEAEENADAAAKAERAFADGVSNILNYDHRAAGRRA